MKEVAAQRQQEEEAFYRQQELMIDAENQRRAMISQEEEKLVDQRSRCVQKKNEWSDMNTYLRMLIPFVECHGRTFALYALTWGE